MKVSTLLEGEYIVRFIDMPWGSHGFVTVDENGFYNIYLNARRSQRDQRIDLKHELEHILNDDLYNAKPITEVEAG